MCAVCVCSTQTTTVARSVSSCAPQANKTFPFSKEQRSYVLGLRALNRADGASERPALPSRAGRAGPGRLMPRVPNSLACCLHPLTPAPPCRPAPPPRPAAAGNDYANGNYRMGEWCADAVNSLLESSGVDKAGVQVHAPPRRIRLRVHAPPRNHNERNSGDRRAPMASALRQKSADLMSC